MKKVIVFCILFVGFSTVMNAQCSFGPMTAIGNDCTCYNFWDASVSVNIANPTGNESTTITDSAGTILNIAGSNVANNLPSGWYYYSVTDGSCTEGPDSIFIDQPDSISASINVINLLCHGDSTSAYVDTVFGWQGSYSNLAYFWNPSTGVPSGIGVDSMYNMTDGNYTLIINDEFGCSNSFNLSITAPPALVFDNLMVTHDDGSGTSGVVSCSASGGTPDYDYTWTDLQNMNTSANTTWGGLGAGCYQILVQDNNGCELIDTVCIGYAGITTLSKDDILIYPSIIRNKEIKVKMQYHQNATLSIYNLAGDLVDFYRIEEGENSYSLNVKPGQYVYQLNSLDKSVLKSGKLTVVN